MKLLEQVRDVIRKRHYSHKTEQSYVSWIKQYILFHQKRHPNEMGEEEINSFLSYLLTDRNVSASTQNQAMNALVFLYKHVLQKELGNFGKFERAKTSRKLPTVLSRGEVARVLPALEGTNRLMGQLLYGTGMRLMECIRLRVKDVDFDLGQIVIRDGKGRKDRVSLLPESLIEYLLAHLKDVRLIHDNDIYPCAEPGS